MTHPLVKAVAQALCRASYPNADIEQPAMRWDHVDGVMNPTDQPMWTDHVDDARAALVATLAGIREPSEGMKHSGTEFLYGEDFVENPAAVTTAVGTWHFMIDALRAELLPSNEPATVSAASAKTVAPNQQKLWPEGCYKPGSCERHRRCGYANCPHLHRDIAAEIDAAVAKLRAERSAAALLPPPGDVGSNSGANHE